MPDFRPNRYRLYIDETGDHSYKNLDRAADRYLGLLGVWFKQPAEDADFAKQLRNFKDTIFGVRSSSSQIVLHRKDILNKRGPFVILKDKETHKKFDDALLSVITNADFKLVCVVIDKQYHKNQYIYPDDPYHFCLKAMLDRYCGWLTYKNSVGDVLAEARGKSYDRTLQLAYEQILERGTLFQQNHKQVLTSKEIKFVNKKADISGLELADLLAYPVKQAILRDHGQVSQLSPFTERLVQIAEFKYNRNEWQKRIEGYGKVWLGPKFPKK